MNLTSCGGFFSRLTCDLFLQGFYYLVDTLIFFFFFYLWLAFHTENKVLFILVILMLMMLMLMMELTTLIMAIIITGYQDNTMANKRSCLAVSSPLCYSYGHTPWPSSRC